MSDPLIEENLKKLISSWSGSFHVLPYSMIKQISENNLKGFRVTSSQIKFQTNFNAKDMSWNHMDFTHRPWIHKHYTDGLRVALGKDVSFGFTPWKGTPFLIPTFDVRVGEHEFLHGYNLAGLFYVFMNIQIVASGNENIWSLEWFILSRNYFRFIHPILHKSMKKMNRKLFEEDLPVKSHRKKLREKGYTFFNDEPDFYSSTILFPNNIRRPISPEIHFDIKLVEVGEKKVLTSHQREFLIFRDEPNSVLVWDNICSHQGAQLENGTVCDGFVTCPWHGLRFAGTRLSALDSARENSSFRATLTGSLLSIIPKA